MPVSSDRIRPIAVAACALIAIAALIPAVPTMAEPSDETPAMGIAINANPAWPASVLLITNNRLAEEWLPFASFKTKLGKRTEVVTIEAIWNAYRGADMQARIKACITDFVATRETRWVVLGGDSTATGGVVPDRDTSHPRMDWSDVPTDLWYVSETNWDADGDGEYGNWSTDRSAISYATRAAIGRIPVRTAADIEAFTAKVIAYETAYPATDFATRLVVTCTEERGYDRVENMWTIISEEWAGTLAKFFTDETPWDERTAGDYALDVTNLAERINAHEAGKWHLIGHGNPNAWVLEDGRLTAAGASELENEAPLLVTTVSCHTGRFDGDREPCASEGMLRGTGGAVVVLAPARPGLSARSIAGEDDESADIDGLNLLYTRFWQYGLDGSGLTVGEAFAKARLAVAPDTSGRRGVKDHFTLCEVNLLGDPTLGFRATDPLSPRVGGQRVIESDARFVNVTTNTPGATVCVWQDGHVYTTATTNDRGNVRVPVSGLVAGRAWVTVCGPNINAVWREVTVR